MREMIFTRTEKEIGLNETPTFERLHLLDKRPVLFASAGEDFSLIDPFDVVTRVDPQRRLARGGT